MKLYRNIIFAAMLVLSFSAKSQQIPQFTQFMIRPSLYNPGGSGTENELCVFAAGRNQWIGFKDEEGNKISPNNYLVGATMPLSLKNSGAGLIFGYDKIGYQTNTSIRLDYSYKKKIGEGKVLSGGVALQMSQVSLDISKLVPFDPNDPLLKETGKQKDIIPEAGIGFLYSDTDKWWAGVSFLNLFGSKATLGNIELQDKTTMVAEGLYKFNLVKNRSRKIDLAPAFLVKTNFANAQFDLNVIGFLNDAVWLGAGYRLDDGVVLLGGIQTNNTKVGISYDFTTNEVRQATKAGSVEVHLSYAIPLHLKNSKSNALNERPTTTNNNKWIRIKDSRRVTQKIKLRSMFNTRHL